MRCAGSRGPDGDAYWLTPADFDRVVRAELAALNEQGAAQLVARGIALAADGHVELARVAGQLALRHDPEDVAAQDLARLPLRGFTAAARAILRRSDPERFRPGRPEQTRARKR